MTDERLTLADLARHLEPRMNRSTIQRYDNNEELRALLGKDTKSYPASTLRFWNALADARSQEPPLVKPETAAVFVRSLMEQGAGELPDVPLSTALTTIRPDAKDLVIASERGEQVISLLQSLLESSERREAVQDDALLLIKQAAEQYGVSPKSLRSISVLEGGRRKVRRSDVLRYIAGLTTDK